MLQVPRYPNNPEENWGPKARAGAPLKRKAEPAPEEGEGGEGAAQGAPKAAKADE
jgi:hypothetical protein